MNEIKIEDAAKHFLGRAVKSMYHDHTSTPRIVLKFHGTEQYLVLPPGVEIINGEDE